MKMHILKFDKCEEKIKWSKTECVITFQLFFILFERYFIQLGAPNSIIYIIDILNIYLLLKLSLKNVKSNFKGLILLYIFLIGGSTLVAFANYLVFGNNIIFTILEIRNILRFLIFFLAVINYFKAEHLDFIFSIIELHFFINSFFIIYMFFSYFPSDAAGMRGDLLNGFFGNMRGGNIFVNVEMMIVLLYSFVKWRKKDENILSFIIKFTIAILIAGLIEIKAFFIEVAIIYGWYLIFVKKDKREKIINIFMCLFFIIIGYVAIQLMLIEYPWFADVFTIRGLMEFVFSKNYSTTDDINRFTGFSTISNLMFNNNIIYILFGVGIGNGAVSQFAGKMTVFANAFGNSHYSWFQGTYLFVQCGIVGLIIYLSTFIYLFIKKKVNKYTLFSNMIILFSLFLVFYGEALKTDIGYLIYFSIASGFLNFKNKDMKGIKNVIVDNNTSL